jgi:predicted aldo/keto reductase-like oxidoreductase
MTIKKHLGRREFLNSSLRGLAGAAGLAAGAKRVSGQATPPAQTTPAAPQAAATQEPAKVKGFRTLGRTGFRVSDIGTGSIYDQGVLRAMLEAGVNYIDTAESYPGHHRLVGGAIKGLDRKSLFISTKMLMDEGDISREGLLKRARKGLEDLGTDYVDCLMMHLPEKVETLGLDSFHQAMSQMKTEGRLRFVGISHHGSFWFRDPETAMDRVLLAAAEDGRFDVFLFAYNFLQMDGGQRVLDACRRKNIGAALMKTKPVITYYSLKSRIEALEKAGKSVDPLFREGLERYKEKADKAEEFIAKHGLKNPEEIKEASVRFVLDNPDVHTVCCSARTFDEAERFVRLSGARLSDGDKAELAAYRESCGQLYCRHACGLCEPSCPQGVPVNTIMRYNHYFETQGREKYAMSLYAAIPGSRAEVCHSCPGHCERACPHGLPIQGMLFLAHHQLTLA